MAPTNHLTQMPISYYAFYCISAYDAFDAPTSRRAFVIRMAFMHTSQYSGCYFARPAECTRRRLIFARAAGSALACAIKTRFGDYIANKYVGQHRFLYCRDRFHLVLHFMPIVSRQLLLLYRIHNNRKY